ncbi:putative GDP-fucose protein O-fucosyltransferase [Rosa chinensis]|uniref:O-fucosyltransferase family protein n=1 Tax=Rosa chinensis TaxID=74649 RepID=A0A2P6RZR7_ROSCH|nr:protein MANNAN SYNTHESIS-RELATED 1 [Rosa chinensis]PRQ51928.1 putative GDP-fucose protein O-fucosyltransferase [Rosa chinensis]
MGVDLRQVVAGILTVTMFVMLGHMIKRDHFDYVEEKFPGEGRDALENAKISKEGLFSLAKKGGNFNDDGEELKPCWSKPALDDVEQTEGFVLFSLTNGPEYHVSQIADAVVVARYLGATLVVPDIRGSKPGDERSFEEIYDVEKFILSLDGVVRVAKERPGKLSSRNLAAVKVPNRVTEDYIVEHVEPIYRSKGNIRLATYFPSVNMKKTEKKSASDSVACLGMFGTLELQPEISEVVDSTVERLRTLSRKTNGQFIAVDLRVEMLEQNGCQGDESGTKSCYNPQEIALFLRKIGFGKDTTIYVTESRWDSSLDNLKDIFPKTYVKDGIIPADKKSKFLGSEGSEFEKIIDYYVCSQSDVFVPAISGLFYANVAGKRIASSKTEILVPADISSSSASATNFITHYVSKKNHLAYSCFC